MCVCSVDDVVDESDDNEEADADTENDTENDDDDKDLLVAVTLSTHTHTPYFTWQHYNCVLFRVQNVQHIFPAWQMLWTFLYHHYIPNQIFLNLHIVIPSSSFGDIVLCGAAVHMIPSVQRRAAITHQSMPNTFLSLCQTCQTCIYSCWFNLNTVLPLPSVCKKSRMALTTSQAPLNPSKTKWPHKMSRLWCLCKRLSLPSSFHLMAIEHYLQIETDSTQFEV